MIKLQDKAISDWINGGKLPRKFIVEFDAFRALTFKERLMILIGYNIGVRVTFRIDKRTGDIGHFVNFSLTENQSAKQVIEENQKAELEKEMVKSLANVGGGE